jgi:hypothetical protein
MQGDLADIVARLRATLPKRWFGDAAPNANAFLAGLANPAVWLFDFIKYLLAQTRLSTASNLWLDLSALDYFGGNLKRWPTESDDSFRSRIRARLFRSAATRPAMISALTLLSGKAPIIFEPTRVEDTGSYGSLTSGPNMIATMAYGQLGAWGNLHLPNQVFLTVYRPATPVVSNLSGYDCSYAGYGTGPLSYVDLGTLVGDVSDAEIQQTIVELLPVNATAWLRLI